MLAPARLQPSTVPRANTLTSADASKQCDNDTNNGVITPRT